jgi:hypoxia up-regulated 1
LIYAFRDWLNEENHLRFIGSAEIQEELLSKLSAGEEWLLEGEGEHATYQQYLDKYHEFNEVYEKLRVRKEESTRRPETISAFRKRLSSLEDEVRDLAETKPWINETHRTELLEKLAEIRTWLDEQVGKQTTLSPADDPILRVADIE